MNLYKKEPKPTATRISVSLPPQLAVALDDMVQQRGFHNRSQALADMIQQKLIEHRQDNTDQVMAGTITLIYDSSKPEVLEKLTRIERDHIAEVISSQHVLLEGHYIMEVVLVQGPVHRLRTITDRMITCKGVNSGGLTLTDKLIPQVHGRSH